MVLASKRSVQNNILYSNASPVMRIKVDSSFTYVGNLNFILYDVAQVEQHHFVITDSHQEVVRLLWFQFEGYLDNNQHTYNYSTSLKLEVAGYDFFYDTAVFNIDKDFQQRPTSDGAQAVTFLKEHGYGYRGDTIVERLVWLDHDQRKELMIIYSENLKVMGLDQEQVVKIDRNSNQWVELTQDFHKRALGSFTIVTA